MFEHGRDLSLVETPGPVPIRHIACSIGCCSKSGPQALIAENPGWLGRSQVRANPNLTSCALNVHAVRWKETWKMVRC
jgi:hypothetical protein